MTDLDKLRALLPAGRLEKTERACGIVTRGRETPTAATAFTTATVGAKTMALRGAGTRELPEAMRP